MKRDRKACSQESDVADYLVARLARASGISGAGRRASENGTAGTAARPTEERAIKPIVSITAYDYFTALLAAQADVDFVLVGDSLGNVVQGRSTTVPVTLEQMVYHTQLVCRHFPAERVVLDLPFGSFKQTAELTVANAVRAFQESGCGGVKLEGADASSLTAIERLRALGVPVIGHLGLLPQRINADGAYRMQGKTPEAAQQLLHEARALQAAGAIAVVLECVIPAVAEEITAALDIPTIGIGSGAGCSGQILVVHDVLGMLPGQPASFVKQYAQVFELASSAVREYADEVRSGEFPVPGGAGVPTRDQRSATVTGEGITKQDGGQGRPPHQGRAVER
jgi:3-methyl-2-oxobutanoate hydroxymethyltransferase